MDDDLRIELVEIAETRMRPIPETPPHYHLVRVGSSGRSIDPALCGLLPRRGWDPLVRPGPPAQTLEELRARTNARAIAQCTTPCPACRKKARAIYGGVYGWDDHRTTAQ